MIQAAGDGSGGGAAAAAAAGSSIGTIIDSNNPRDAQSAPMITATNESGSLPDLTTSIGDTAGGRKVMGLTGSGGATVLGKRKKETDEQDHDRAFSWPSGIKLAKKEEAEDEDSVATIPIPPPPLNGSSSSLQQQQGAPDFSLSVPQEPSASSLLPSSPPSAVAPAAATITTTRTRTRPISEHYIV